MAAVSAFGHPVGPTSSSRRWDVMGYIFPLSLGIPGNMLARIILGVEDAIWATLQPVRYTNTAPQRAMWWPGREEPIPTRPPIAVNLTRRWGGRIPEGSPSVGAAALMRNGGPRSHPLCRGDVNSQSIRSVRD